ncbi:MAG: sec-independent protein translocase protein TatA [Chlamydiales bacterium]|jgi:sec-independent protein translocase protein TatA
MLGAWEIIVILFVVLLLFGGKKLPELARSLGEGIREFKKASQEISQELEVRDVAQTPPSAHKSKENEKILEVEPEEKKTGG